MTPTDMTSHGASLTDAMIDVAATLDHDDAASAGHHPDRTVLDHQALVSTDPAGLRASTWNPATRFSAATALQADAAVGD